MNPFGVTFSENVSVASASVSPMIGTETEATVCPARKVIEPVVSV